MKRQIAWTFILGTGIGLTGCQSPSLGGLAFWNRDNATLGSPDAGSQKFGGLFGGDQPRPMGQSQAGTAAIGAPRPGANDGFFMASWKKTTAAVTGATAVKATSEVPEGDPVRLDAMPKRIGPEVYVGAARLLENKGNYPEAEGKYHEALKAAPDNLAALVGLARLHDRQGQGQKAIEVYQKAAQLHPTNGLVYNDMGLCYRRQQQLDKSLAAFRKAVDLHKDNPKYRNNLAAALVDAGRSDEAFHELAILNSHAVAHFNLAWLLQQKGRPSDAARHLQEALAIDPALTPARDMLAKMGVSPADTPEISATQTSPLRLNQPEHDVNMPYAAAATEQPVYTSAPQVDSTARLPSSFHIGDDASPAAETAQRTNWGSAAWALPAGPDAKGSHPLPPIE